MQLQLAVGIAVHHAMRSRQLITMLHGFGMSVDYNRILRVEAQIEASVLKRMELNDGLYIPPDVVQSRQVFVAVDNVDFAEDTPDGKNTFHGTAMAIYQRQEPGDVEPELTVDPGEQCTRSITQLPESVARMPCAHRKACWSHLPPVWIVYRRSTSIVHQEARFHVASRAQFDQIDHQ